MKRTAILTGILVLLTGCFPDDRNNYMVPDSFGISSLTAVQEASVHTGVFSLGIAKSGVGQSAGQVQISIAGNEALIKDYNTANGTHYKAVQASLVSLDKEVLSFDVKDVAKTVSLGWNPETLAAAIGTDTDYVIPLSISSTGPEVQPKRSFVMVHLNRSGVNVAQTSVSRVIEAKNVEAGKDGTQPELQEVITLDISLKPAIKNLGVSFPVCIDNSLIDDYNAVYGSSFQAAPEGLLTLVDPQAVIDEGKIGGTFRICLDKEVLLKGGKLEPFPDYLIPVRVQDEKLSATLSGESFDLKGLSYSNLVTYVAVTYYAPPPGLSVIRLWGKYSTEGSPWSSYIDGFTANTDRNVAIDDNYIYIAETNQSKNLWAISKADPGIYRKLPVGTVEDAGIFYLSCPRIITNTNPEINGGQDLLAVSNMNEGNLMLYVYVNGIEEDPSAIKLETWASRRLGDTFTWWGSWQSGTLFFKDFNSAQGTVTFPMGGKTTGTLYLFGRIVAPPVTGAGAYFPFPEDINHGISTVRGGEMSWLTASSKDLSTLEGADNDPTLTELSGYYTDTAFRFFQYDGKPYIAYTRQVSSDDGRLYILEGKAGQSWASMLDERNIIYQAVIQNDSEQDEIDETPSPLPSGNSGMDLDVRITDGEVYIAVIKQNVGLSLFRMSVN